MRDRDLVARAQDGDRAAFDLLVERYRAATFGMAYALLGHAHDAEDVTQEALTHAWRRLGDLREPDKFAGWLFRIVQNQCRNLLSRSPPSMLSIEQALERVESWDETNDDAAHAIRVALRSLSDPLRETATLVYLDGYPLKDVAARLGVPIGTVKRRLFDARRQLKSQLALQSHHLTAQKGVPAMRLFTGKGDQGTTDLLGTRLSKDAPQVAALGALDEATSAIGLGRALATSTRTKEVLAEVQRDLYRIMAGIAFTGATRPAGYTLGAERVTDLETVIDNLAGHLEIPAQFILPGDSVAGAALDVARTIVRRAEREAVSLANRGDLNQPEVQRYVNRLSSLLFVLARFEDHEAGVVPLQAKTAVERNATRSVPEQ